MPTTNDILGVIMGGGRGTRLYPLTKLRAKPAVPLAGKYRLIDIPLSNCINAGIHKIAVLTQFKSVSLHRHISRTYVFDAFSHGWVQILAAEQTDKSFDWYQGTADSVRKQLLEVESAETEYTLILAGDHLYRMDYKKLADFHWKMGAEITVAVQPVLRGDAARFGIVKTDTDGRIVSFTEKPSNQNKRNSLVTRKDEARPYLGSLGIYLFNTNVLIDLLQNSNDTDFGSEVIPRAIQSRIVYGYEFSDYWEDIGTIRAFYNTNLQLTQTDPLFNFFDPEDPIYTRPRFLPGSVVQETNLHNVLLADGGQISGAQIQNSVIGIRSQIAQGASISSTIMMGADYYDSEVMIKSFNGLRCGIGEGASIEGAIIDKNVRIGASVIIKPFPIGTEIDREDWVVRDGIVVIPKNAILPSGTSITPEDV
jgi:glucose-1-phosphate adenylyltransferase